MIKKVSIFLQQKLIAIWFFLTDARYRVICRSGLFDEKYYLASNPDLTRWALFPLAHYVRKGWREGRQPNPFFDPRFYLLTYPDIRENSLEPFVHYLQEGWRKGYVPSPHFFPDYYLAQRPLFPDTIGNPLAYYLYYGSHESKKAIPYFDPDYYQKIYPDVVQSGLHPHYHYLTIGALEQRNPSPFFDVAWYLDRTPVLRTLSFEPVTHYIEFGAGEGKSPLPLFDPQYYRQQNLDVDPRGDLFTHYLTVGLAEDRRPSRWFDPGFYRRLYLAHVGTDLSPLEHYLEIGVHEQRYPDPLVQDLPQKPLISLVVPVYNVEEHYLNNCIRSVLYQAYPHWELCLADDCSSQPHVRQVLEKWAQRDPRIKVTFLESNQGISGATNAAAALATGKYIAFLDNDDELTVDCLYQVAKVIGETGADLLYTDEDLVGDDGSRLSVFYKPGFNSELLLSHNYITHLLVSRRTLFEAAGGLDAQYDGAQDYDLVLKLSEQAGRIVHIPQVLYHWRASETSTSINHEQKSYADEAGRKALIGAMRRRGIEAEVQATDWKFYYRVERKLLTRPLVSLLVYWHNDLADVAAWVRSLLAVTAYDRFEILVLVSGAADKQASCRLALSEIGDTLVCLEAPEDLSQAALYNLAAKQSRGEFLVFIDGDVTIQAADWLERLLVQAQQKGAGAIAPRLQKMGEGEEAIETLPCLSNDSSWYYLNFVQQCSLHMNGLQWSQKVLAVSWDLCLVSQELFALCAGFDDKNMPSLFWGLDFCLRVREQGYENLSLSCGLGERGERKYMDDQGEPAEWAQERRVFQDRWRKHLVEGDPYYNVGVLDRKQIPVDEFLQWYAGS